MKDNLMKRFLLIALLPFLLLNSCVSPAQKEANQVSALVGLEGSELKAGRFDLVSKTQGELQRLVPASKTNVKINALHGTIFKEGELPNVVVLPSGTNMSQVVAENSAEFNKVINSTPANKSEEKRDESIIKKSDAKTTEVIAAVAYAKAHPPHGFLWWAFHIFSGIGIVGVIALIVLCFFFPAIIPIVMGILKDIYEVISYLLKSVASLFAKK